MAKDLKPIADLGATGESVRANIKRLRESSNLTYAELSRRLGDIDRPIPTLGLRRIEAGARRVDVDDLMALAIVFDVNANTLLLPPVDDPNYVVELTGARLQPAWRVWRWAGYGTEPLFYEQGLAHDAEARFERSREAFKVRAHPGYTDDYGPCAHPVKGNNKAGSGHADT